ncbi:conserved hypothetical protein [Planktothrix tepida PCC 9214]|uniref:Uncharacterized protein n=1 Tax=Planktothrix tepida PCC 9214 TaxID=671072 RepID=A0A1J1LKS6_9CYAN|nr:conserved hypothetical protein [Planktothrix tepida PCC 9214]
MFLHERQWFQSLIGIIADFNRKQKRKMRWGQFQSLIGIIADFNIKY